MSDLLIPFAPSNLVLPPEMKNAPVEGDVYRICERIKEVSPRLRVVPLIDHPQGYRYLIMELCDDGIERGVIKVHELDDRVVQRLKYLLSVPLSQRMKKIEEQERRWEEQEKERELDELYERMGREMWIDLEKCGFIETRPVSFPKKGIKPKKEE